ncbi:LUD domain-containing protein [Actinomycetospora sp. TBRC 11914]|uniref:LutC/YkgG family protein n=1 Tax=Actinomycetospora sp. TBRC 11914 TaxID=2729387 RepID=UPI00145D35C0|nr:LUD domain-containing protein [Actinomycetospora sp. TBRC 11914]NMO93621.1 LUD domain-containing protein [Actinomycetospora sp. TBRC 11914]
MDARSEVLARLRTARDAGAPATAVVVPREYRSAGRHEPGGEAVVARLEETLTDYGASVRRVAAEDDVAGAVAAFLGPAAAVVVPPGLSDAWLADHPGRVRRDEPPATVDELDHLDAVVTGVAVAIAETGTFVLASGAPDQGRRAITLVPDHHVCVIRAADVVSSVPEAIARLDPSRPLTFVSGPSATSDIELDRVEGVHGPRRLDVVLLGALRAREH